jgi:hypothetical protein
MFKLLIFIFGLIWNIALVAFWLTVALISLVTTFSLGEASDFFDWK